jgi:hypothetical protein
VARSSLDPGQCELNPRNGALRAVPVHGVMANAKSPFGKALGQNPAILSTIRGLGTGQVLGLTGPKRLAKETATESVSSNPFLGSRPA